MNERVFGASNEPLVTLGPLVGFFVQFQDREPDYDLRDALAPFLAKSSKVNLNPTVLEAIVKASCKRGDEIKKSGAKLSVAEIAAISLYSAEFGSGQSFYTILNSQLRDADRLNLRNFIKYIYLLMSGLSKCPLSPVNNVFRGIKFSTQAEFAAVLSKYQVDREFVWNQFSSCTTNIEVLNSESFLGKTGWRIVFTIELTTSRARSISAMSLVPKEEEVLLPANSKFRVIGCLRPSNNYVMIQLREVEPDDPIVPMKIPLAINFGSSSASASTAASGKGELDVAVEAFCADVRTAGATWRWSVPLRQKLLELVNIATDYASKSNIPIEGEITATLKRVADAFPAENVNASVKALRSQMAGKLEKAPSKAAAQSEEAVAQAAALRQHLEEGAAEERVKEQTAAASRLQEQENVIKHSKAEETAKTKRLKAEQEASKQCAVQLATSERRKQLLQTLSELALVEEEAGKKMIAETEAVERHRKAEDMAAGKRVKAEAAVVQHQLAENNAAAKRKQLEQLAVAQAPCEIDGAKVKRKKQETHEPKI